MDDSTLRKIVRDIISEYYNNAWVYTYGPNKFPNFEDAIKTPSDLNAEFDLEFGTQDDELEEDIDVENSTRKVNKKPVFTNKH